MEGAQREGRPGDPRNKLEPSMQAEEQAEPTGHLEPLLFGAPPAGGAPSHFGPQEICSSPAGPIPPGRQESRAARRSTSSGGSWRSSPCNFHNATDSRRGAASLSPRGRVYNEPAARWPGPCGGSADTWRRGNPRCLPPRGRGIGKHNRDSAPVRSPARRAQILSVMRSGQLLRGRIRSACTPPARA